MRKAECLKRLGAQRQGTDPYRASDRPIGEYGRGAYESEFVSPYTISACNVNAEVMIILQDWASHNYLIERAPLALRQLGHDPKLATNKRLKGLLRTHLGLSLGQTFATNLYPFVKAGDMSGSIPHALLVRAAVDFTVPQIDIVQPRLVVCIGLVTFSAIQAAYGHRPAKSLALAIERPFECGASRLWCQAHTGALGYNNRNRGGVNRVAVDWTKMAEWIDSERRRRSAA